MGVDEDYCSPVVRQGSKSLDLLGPNQAKSHGSFKRSLFVWRESIKTVDVRDEKMQSMRISGAARCLGYKSHSQLYKLINDGWLDEHVHVQMPSGQRLLDVEGLQESLQGLC